LFEIYRLDVGAADPAAGAEDHMATRPDLRIGDSDREAAATFLREHYAQGRLTLEEFNERLNAIFAATTQGQLSAITRDLPYVGVAAASPPRAQADARQERSRQRHQSAPPRGLRMLPVIIAVMAVWLVLFDLHLRFFFWPGRLAIFLAVFAAARGLMRWVWRQGGGPRGGYPRGRRSGRPRGGYPRGPWGGGI
jgi:hypothetical protein